MLWFRFFCVKLCFTVVMSHTLNPADRENLCKFKDCFVCRGCPRIGRLHKVILSQNPIKNLLIIRKIPAVAFLVSSSLPMFLLHIKTDQGIMTLLVKMCVCIHTWKNLKLGYICIFEFLNDLRNGLHGASSTIYVICVSTIIA